MVEEEDRCTLYTHAREIFARIFQIRVKLGVIITTEALHQAEPERQESYGEVQNH